MSSAFSACQVFPTADPTVYSVSITRHILRAGSTRRSSILCRPTVVCSRLVLLGFTISTPLEFPELTFCHQQI